MRAPGITNVGMGYVDAKLDAIYGLDEAMPVLSSTGGTLTADGSEQNLYYDNEPLGVFRPIAFVIDLDAMEGGDTIEVKIYHRLSDAGGLQLLSYNTWTGADGGLSNSEKVDVVDLHPNRHGYRITLDQTAGTNRAYPWEIFLEV